MCHRSTSLIFGEDLVIGSRILRTQVYQANGQRGTLLGGGIWSASEEGPTASQASKIWSLAPSRMGQNRPPYGAMFTRTGLRSMPGSFGWRNFETSDFADSLVENIS